MKSDSNGDFALLENIVLIQAIFNKAFKGELVEQLESDGSAEEFLMETMLLMVANDSK